MAGAAQAGVGLGGMALGWTLTETGIGSVVGIPLIGASADWGGAGLRKAWSAHHEPTLVGKVAGSEAEKWEGAIVGGAGLAGMFRGAASRAISAAGARATAPEAGAPAPPPPAEGPVVGGGASLKNITPGEAVRIQNAANRIKTAITLVGSRAGGTATEASDWDYVINASSRVRHSVSTSLPGASTLDRLPSTVDIFPGNVIDTTKPFITFNPK